MKRYKILTKDKKKRDKPFNRILLSEAFIRVVEQRSAMVSETQRDYVFLSGTSILAKKHVEIFQAENDKCISALEAAGLRSKLLTVKNLSLVWCVASKSFSSEAESAGQRYSETLDKINSIVFEKGELSKDEKPLLKKALINCGFLLSLVETRYDYYHYSIAKASLKTKNDPEFEILGEILLNSIEELECHLETTMSLLTRAESQILQSIRKIPEDWSEGYVAFVSITGLAFGVLAFFIISFLLFERFDMKIGR